MSGDGGELVTVPEAGRILGVSDATVWRMIRRGALSSVRRRGRRLVVAADLRSRSAEALSERIPPLREDHPIFRLVGAGRSGGNPPGARDKHAILDE